MNALRRVLQFLLGKDRSAQLQYRLDSLSLRARNNREDNNEERPTGPSEEPVDFPAYPPPCEYSSKAEWVVDTGLTPEDYLERLLASRGKIEQQEICELTGWSKSSVSRLLQKLDDQGTLIQIPIGRSNTVYHPDTFTQRDEEDIQG